MVEKGLRICLPVAWHHNLEDDLEFDQGNAYGNRPWFAAADKQTRFLLLKTFEYLR